MSRWFTTVCVASCGLVCGGITIAQVRSTAGWTNSKPAPTQVHSATPDESSVVQTAFFQSPDGLPPLPGNLGLPVGNGPTVSPPVLPAEQGLPAPVGNLSDSINSGYGANGNYNQPAPVPQYQSGPAQLPSYQQPVNGGSSRQTQPNYQPNNSPNFAPGPSPFQTTSSGNQLRAVQNQGNGQRQVAGSPVGFGPNANQPPITTGLPYVTPPPARYGNYPTSPYNSAIFRNVSYQTPAQPMLNTADIANTQPVLPQNMAGYQATVPCGPVAGVATYPATGAVPGAYVPPTVTPNLTPGLYSPNNSGYSPVFTLGQENYNVQLGRGIIGQPTVYVPGQPIRNFLRYLSP